MEKTELVNAFIFDCQTRGRTKRTLESYKGTVKEFLNFFPKLETVDKHDLRDFLSHLQERELKIATLETCFSTLSTFYDFLIYEEIAEINPILPFRRRYLDKPTRNDRQQLISVKAMKHFMGPLNLSENKPCSLPWQSMGCAWESTSTSKTIILTCGETR